MKYFLFALASSLLLPACTEDFFSQTVEIDPPPYDKQLSFHLSLTNRDSAVEVLMSRNYGILEDLKAFEDWFVKNVETTIYEDGQKFMTLTPVDPDESYLLTGTLPHPFQPGHTYEIRAEHPDFPKVNAVQMAPNDFQVDSVRIRYDAVPDESGGRLNLLEVYLQDQKDVKNYYEVRISGQFYQFVYNAGGMDTVGIHEETLYTSGYNDPNIQDGYDGNGQVSDQFFDGQPYKFQARFYGRPYELIDSTLYVSVRSVTEDYFKWSRSYQANYDAEDNPFVEPISIFNNLNNGLGIFSIANEKVYVIKR